MNELLELEPRETDADELDVDTAFSGIADARREPGRCPRCRGDDAGDRFLAPGMPW